MKRILLIEKDPRIAALLQCRSAARVRVKRVDNIEAALVKLATHKFDLIYWNAVCGPAASVSFPAALSDFSSRCSGARIIVVSDVMRPEFDRERGAHVQIQRHPMSEEDLLSTIEEACLVDCDSGGRMAGAETCGPAMEFEGMVAVGLGMRRVFRQIKDAAAVDIPVLITGETGTGKDLVAAAIHRQSRRRNNAYVPVNMGAMPRELIASEIFGHEKGSFTGAHDSRPGIFEQASHGTVFLDEIATMDDKTQVSLLRVLEEKTVRRVGGARNIAVDVRVIAATNEDLEGMVAQRRFRGDLFYRLNVFHISVPPLRERAGAVAVLTDYFLTRFADLYDKAVDSIAAETYKMLCRYPWPGNVRELKNVIQTAVLMVNGNELTPEFLPARIRETDSARETCDDATISIRVGATLNTVEKELIRKTLARVGGNKKLAASILGISRRALYNKINRA